LSAQDVYKGFDFSPGEWSMFQENEHLNSTASEKLKLSISRLFANAEHGCILNGYTVVFCNYIGCSAGIDYYRKSCSN